MAPGNGGVTMATRRLRALVLAAGLTGLLFPTRAAAHCDALDGPVVLDARAALASGRLDPALKWVGPEKEAELREAFAQALAVRVSGDQARALADRFFLETLVRLHREGEGAPFTGLKPAGHIEPAIAAADQALAGGAVEPLLLKIGAEAERGVRQRFARARAARARAEESVALGREAVAAYVDFVHHVERLLAAAGADAPHGHDASHGHP
jgi:hypothetical protein